MATYAWFIWGLACVAVVTFLVNDRGRAWMEGQCLTIRYHANLEAYCGTSLADAVVYVMAGSSIAFLMWLKDEPPTSRICVKCNGRRGSETFEGDSCNGHGICDGGSRIWTPCSACGGSGQQ